MRKSRKESLNAIQEKYLKESWKSRKNHREIPGKFSRIIRKRILKVCPEGFIEGILRAVLDGIWETSMNESRTNSLQKSMEKYWEKFLTEFQKGILEECLKECWWNL